MLLPESSPWTASSDKVSPFVTSADEGVKNIFIYLLVFLLLPFLCVSLSLLFWFLYIRGNKRKAANRAITTVIILFFLLHPSLTKSIFNIFL